MGDPARSFAQMLGGDLPFNPPFEMDNRSKRSVVLDLSTEDGRALALELVAGADVFLTNLRRPALARAGLDVESLRGHNPRLVYAAISGYGFAGEDADRAAYDIAAFWSRSGVASALQRPGQPPPFQRGGMGDHISGLSLAAGISAALFQRERTGAGQFVSTSLMRQGIYMLSFDMAITLRFGVAVAGGERTTMGNPTVNCYQDRDGRWFWVVGLEGTRHWPPLARVVGHPEWIDDPKFATPAARAQNAKELIAALDAEFAKKSREEWEAVFATEEDFWWAPVQGIDEVVADPQTRAAGGLVEVPDGPSTTTLPATPVDFSDSPWEPRHMAPGHGEHTDEVLRELGRDDAAIAALREKGVVA